jgi:hypothetical protein
MAKLDQDWDEIPVDESKGEFGPQIPDGQHQAMIVDAGVNQRQSDDHWQFYLKLQNRLGSVRKWSDLDHEIGAQVAKGDLAKLGYDDKPSKLAEHAHEFIGLVCDIGVKTKPGESRDFTNVYINRVHGKAQDPSMFEVSAEAQEPAFAPSASDDDIPF